MGIQASMSDRVLIGALEFFGFTIPSSGFALAVAALMILFLLANRNGGLDAGGGRGGRTGRGRMYQCTRCGRNFQPEQVELLAGGQTRVSYDDRCPNCGWDLEWGDADKKRPGGASGKW